MSLQDTPEYGQLSMQPSSQKRHELQARIAAQRAKAAAKAPEIARQQAKQAECQARAAGLPLPPQPVSPQPPAATATGSADAVAPAPPELPAPESAKLVLLREWPSTKRGIPSALVRCPLFAGVLQTRGRQADESLLLAQPGYIAIRRVTGAEWVQYDLTVLLQLVQIADESGRFTFGVDEMLTMLGITPNANTRRALEKSLDRLSGRIRIDVEADEWRHRRRFSLLPDFTWSTRRRGGDATPKCSGRLAEAFIELYLHGGNVTRIDWPQRLTLPAGFAQWLHAYYSSHKEPHPMQAVVLARWAGLDSAPREVNRLIRGALVALQSVGFLSSFEVTRAGLVTVERASR